MVSNESRWLVGKVSRKGEGSAMVRWLAAKPSDWTTLPTAVVITWRFSESSTIEEEFGFMDRFEDLLCPLRSTPDSCLALVRTFADCRAWRFYVSDAEAFVAALNRLVRGHSRFPIQLESEPDPEWSGWQSFDSLTA